MMSLRVFTSGLLLFFFVSAFSQDVAITNTNLSGTENIIFIGATKEGYFTYSYINQDRYIFDFRTIYFIDSRTNKVEKTYYVADFLEMSELKEHSVLAIKVHNNDLLLLCMHKKSGEHFLVKPFKKQVVKLTMVKPQTDLFGNGESTTMMQVSDDAKYVIVFDYLKMSKPYFFNSDLQQEDLDVELKLPKVDRKYEVYFDYSSVGSYFLADYRYNKRKWGIDHWYQYPKMEVLDIPQKDWRSVELPVLEGNGRLYYESHFYDSTMLQAVNSGLLREKRRWVGFYTSTIDLERGSILKKTAKTYSPEQMEKIRQVKLTGDAVNCKSVRLANGDIVYFLRYGDIHGQGTKWGPIHIVAHTSEGEFKWVKKLDNVVWRDNETNFSFIVFAHDSTIELLYSQKGIVNYTISENGDITLRWLSGVNTKLIPSWYYHLGKTEILVPCIANKQKEILKVKF